MPSALQRPLCQKVRPARSEAAGKTSEFENRSNSSSLNPVQAKTQTNLEPAPCGHPAPRARAAEVGAVEGAVERENTRFGRDRLLLGVGVGDAGVASCDAGSAGAVFASTAAAASELGGAVPTNAVAGGGAAGGAAAGGAAVGAAAVGAAAVGAAVVVAAWGGVSCAAAVEASSKRPEIERNGSI